MSEPATKDDLEQATTQLRGEMGAMGEQLRGEMGAMGEQLRGEMRDMKEELLGAMGAMEARLDRHIGEALSQVANVMLEHVGRLVSPVDEKYQDLLPGHAKLRSDFDTHVCRRSLAHVPTCGTRQAGSSPPIAVIFRMIPHAYRDTSEPAMRATEESTTLPLGDVGAMGEPLSDEGMAFREQLRAMEVRICNAFREGLIREFTRVFAVLTEEIRERHRQQDAANAIELRLHQRRLRRRHRHRQRDTGTRPRAMGS